MAWTASAASFEQAPVGNHAAICIKIVDIGTQEGEYKGEKTKRRQVILTWELPHETRDDGQPFIISKFYTMSLGEKANLTKDLTNWLGKSPGAEFEETQLLGKACTVTISKRENSDKHVVSGVSSLTKGVVVPSKPHNPLVYFSLDKFDEEVFNSLSEGIQKMIMKSPEYAQIVNGGSDVGDETAGSSDDIPF